MNEGYILSVDPGTDSFGYVLAEANTGKPILWGFVPVWGIASLFPRDDEGRVEVFLTEHPFVGHNPAAAGETFRTIGVLEGRFNLRAKAIYPNSWRSLLNLPQNSGSTAATRWRVEEHFGLEFPAQSRKEIRRKDGSVVQSARTKVVHHTVDALAILAAWQIAPGRFK
jgi:hypothetical protein